MVSDRAAFLYEGPARTGGWDQLLSSLARLLASLCPCHWTLSSLTQPLAVASSEKLIQEEEQARSQTHQQVTIFITLILGEHI